MPCPPGYDCTPKENYNYLWIGYALATWLIVFVLLPPALKWWHGKVGSRFFWVAMASLVLVLLAAGALIYLFPTSTSGRSRKSR